jgi:pyruvate,water dikinase
MFKAQLLAIKELRKEGIKNVGIMLPFVQSLDEVVKAKEIAKEVELQEEIDFGVMIETPASVWIIDEIIPHVKFVSFGTNDLTQFTLAIDRDNERIASLYDERHPAVQWLIRHVIERCNEAGVESSICGQAGSYPDVVKKLVEYGITSISANPDAVRKIKEMVYRTEQQLLLSRVRELRRGS